MPRPPRPQIPNGVYHVTARGNRRQPIFLEDGDYGRFLNVLDRVARALARRYHAYCLIPNHYHLVFETPNGDLSRGMHWINSSYARWFDHFHALDGHLFQRRFHAVVVETDWHLMELARYVSLNPVRAGLCATPRDWTWSSYGAIVGETEVPSFLAPDLVLTHFGRDHNRARRAFADFVRDGVADGRFGRVPVPGTGPGLSSRRRRCPGSARRGDGRGARRGGRRR
jgi:putative transposase